MTVVKQDNKEKAWNRGETTSLRGSIKQDTIATMKDSVEQGSIFYCLRLPHKGKGVRLDRVGDNGYSLKRNLFDFALLGAEYEMASICYAFWVGFEETKRPSAEPEIETLRSAGHMQKGMKRWP